MFIDQCSSHPVTANGQITAQGSWMYEPGADGIAITGGAYRTAQAS
jgi:hypothetical protein